MRIVAVPVPTGSPAGDSDSPVKTTGKARPPRVGDSTVLGQAPSGAGTMSAACLRWDRSVLPETRSFTYGFLLDDVRWQIVRLASVPAVATVRALPARMTTDNSEPSSFISTLRVGVPATTGMMPPVD